MPIPSSASPARKPSRREETKFAAPTTDRLKLGDSTNCNSVLSALLTLCSQKNIEGHLAGNGLFQEMLPLLTLVSFGPWNQFEQRAAHLRWYHVKATLLVLHRVVDSGQDAADFNRVKPVHKMKANVR